MEESINLPSSVAVSVTLRTDVLNLSDHNDITKIVDFDLSNVSTGTTKTIKVPNNNTILPSYSSKNLKVGSTALLPSGDENTIYGYSAASDLTTGTQNTIIGSEALVGLNSALNRIVIGRGAEGKYDNTFHLASSINYLYLPGLAESVKTKVLYFDSITSKITMGDLPTTETMSSGTVSAPGVKFSVDTDTGFYRPSANTLAITTGGSEIIKFDTQVKISTLGSESVPALTFTDDSDTGIFRSAANTLAFTAGASTSCKIGQGQVLLANGSTSAPSLSFINGSTTGLLYNATPYISALIAGTELLRLNAGQLHINADGSSGTPALIFGTAIDNVGFYRGAGSLTFSASGVVGPTFSAGSLSLPNGSLATPAVQIGTTSNTGLYRSGQYLKICSSNENFVGFKHPGTNPFIEIYKPIVSQYDRSTNYHGYGFDSGFGMSYDWNVNELIFGNSNTTLGITEYLVKPYVQTAAINGSSSSPAYSFASNSGVGMYYDGTYLGFSFNGAETFFTSLTNTIFKTKIKAAGSGSGLNLCDVSATDRITFALNGSETGSNAGSNLYISTFADNGTSLFSGAIQLTRSTGKMTLTQQLLCADGSVGNPGISFSSDTDTGFYRSAGNTFSAVCGGTAVGTFTTSNLSVPGILVNDGSFGAPSLSFSNDTNTGLYRVTTDCVAIVCGGIESLTLNTSNVTPNKPLALQDGTVFNPSLAFASDTTTGLYRSAASTINFATSGISRLVLNTSSLTSTLPILTSSGSDSAPSFSFSADPDTGFYRSASDTIQAVCGAGTAFTTTRTNTTFAGSLTSTTTTSATRFISSTGSVTEPNLSFIGGTTGFYDDGKAGVISISLAGTNYCTMGESGGFVVNSGIKSTTSTAVTGLPANIFKSTATTANSVPTVQILDYRLSTTVLTQLFNITVYDSKFDTYNTLFYVSNNGNVFADGSFNGGGADFAEYFDCKTTLEIGDSVVIDNGFVRKSIDSDAAEDIIGVVRPEKGPILIGNSSGSNDSKALIGLIGQAFVKENQKKNPRWRKIVNEKYLIR